MDQNIQNTSKRPLEHENSEKDNGKRIKADPKILDGQFFEVVVRFNNNNVKAKCIQCGVIRSGSIMGTGNFVRHYNQKHKEILDELHNHIKPKPYMSSARKTQSTINRYV